MQLVFSGGVYIPAAGQEKAPQRPVSPADLGLTERQMDVLTLIMQGKSNKAICRVLDLSDPTVKSHVSAILRLEGQQPGRDCGRDQQEEAA